MVSEPHWLICLLLPWRRWQFWSRCALTESRRPSKLRSLVCISPSSFPKLMELVKLGRQADADVNANPMYREGTTVKKQAISNGKRRWHMEAQAPSSAPTSRLAVLVQLRGR